MKGGGQKPDTPKKKSNAPSPAPPPLPSSPSAVKKRGHKCAAAAERVFRDSRVCSGWGRGGGGGGVWTATPPLLPTAANGAASHSAACPLTPPPLWHIQRQGESQTLAWTLLELLELLDLLELLELLDSCHTAKL